MSMLNELTALFGDIGSEFNTLGKELQAIGARTLDEFRSAPVKYILDSARDLTRMGIHHPVLETLGGTSRPLPDQLRPHVVPLEGCVLYTDLFGKYAQHSGIYIGRGQIAELSGKGRIQKVDRKQFTRGCTGTDIYVSCRQKQAIGSIAVAQRARRQLGSSRRYNVVLDNCHQFCVGCLSGDFENSENFLWMLKDSAENTLGADNWGIWK